MYDVTCNYTYYVVSKIFCQLQITLPTATQWGSEYGCGSKSSPFAQLSGCPMLPIHSTPSLLGHFGLPKIETSSQQKMGTISCRERSPWLGGRAPQWMGSPDLGSPIVSPKKIAVDVLTPAPPHNAQSFAQRLWTADGNDCSRRA